MDVPGAGDEGPTVGVVRPSHIHAGSPFSFGAPLVLPRRLARVADGTDGQVTVPTDRY